MTVIGYSDLFNKPTMYKISSSTSSVLVFIEDDEDDESMTFHQYFSLPLRELIYQIDKRRKGDPIIDSNGDFRLGIS